MRKRAAQQRREGLACRCRQKARKYHPDVNKDPGAEETFKQVCTLPRSCISHRHAPSMSLQWHFTLDACTLCLCNWAWTLKQDGCCADFQCVRGAVRRPEEEPV